MLARRDRRRRAPSGATADSWRRRRSSWRRVLAAVAGFVDAVGFNRLFGVFPANQSGNVAFLGMAIGGDGPAAGWRCALSIAGFAVGTAAGFMLGRRLGPRRKGPTLIVIELVLLVIVTIIAGKVDGHGLSGGFTGVVLVALGSFAMGIQTEAIRRVAGVADRHHLSVGCGRPDR